MRIDAISKHMKKILEPIDRSPWNLENKILEKNIWRKSNLTEEN